jgi:hypothetical protein
VDGNISVLVVLAAGVLSFVLGFVWCTLLFSRPWMTALGIRIEDVESSGLSSARAIVASLAASLATAGGLDLLFDLGDVTSLSLGMGVALVVWVAFGLPPLFRMIFWEDRKPALFAIDGGYELVSIAGAALVLVAWR